MISWLLLVVLAQAPVAPVNLRLVPSAGTLTVGWTPVSNVAGYLISYGTVPGQYTASVKVPADRSVVVLSGLDAGAVYFFIVQAYTSTGDVSDPLQEITGVTTGMP